VQENIKIINAQQAQKTTRIYKNKWEKLLKTNAAIWFNSWCFHACFLLHLVLPDNGSGEPKHVGENKRLIKYTN